MEGVYEMNKYDLYQPNPDNPKSEPTNNQDYFLDKRGGGPNLQNPNNRRLILTLVANLTLCLSAIYILHFTFSLNIAMSFLIPFTVSSIFLVTISNKVTSVVTKTSEHLELLSQNKFQSYELRQNDYFKELDRPINEVTQKILKLNKLEKGKDAFKVLDGEKKAA